MLFPYRANPGFQTGLSLAMVHRQRAMQPRLECRNDEVSLIVPRLKAR
jgi:hypothetical protein